LDVDGTLQCSVAAMNEWFAEQGGIEWRLDTYVTGGRESVDITYIRSKKPMRELVSPERVAPELAAHGLDDPSKRYLTFVEAEGGLRCGDASGKLPPPLADELGDGYDGRHAQVYIDAERCHPRGFGVPGKPSWMEAVAAHEMIHTEGLVPLGAPHNCPNQIPAMSHVCTVSDWATDWEKDPQKHDVMFAYAWAPLSQLKLDIDNDDYFRHSNPALGDLEDSDFVRAVR
jgi:hypothetical protein